MIQPHWLKISAEVKQSNIKHNSLSLSECFITSS